MRKRRKKKRIAIPIAVISLVVFAAILILVAVCAKQNMEKSAETTDAVSEISPKSSLESETSESETIPETSDAASDAAETAPETGTESVTEAEATEAVTAAPETTAETTAGNGSAGSGPSVPEGQVKQMIRQALAYVQADYGYSLEDRCGANGHFDCSGFVATLLYTQFNCPDYYLNGDPYTTGNWRTMAQNYQVGDLIQFGTATYRVSMKDTEDYLTAFSVPGSIVVQYSPTNRPDKTMGHISIALGNISYETTADVVNYIYREYGILLDGTTCTGLPMVYDQYGAGAGHTAFRVNAQSVANCVIVDNNFASDPTWIEPVCIVFEPVY